MKKNTRRTVSLLSIVGFFMIFATPFFFVILNSLKDRRGAGLMRLSWPEEFHFENYLTVITQNDFIVLRSFMNSAIITVGAIFFLVLCGSMTGYILQRRSGKVTGTVNFFLLIGLMLPPAILPTIWVMQAVGIYRSLFSMILIETALNIPFTVMLYRGYMATIPLEIEEAAIIDGCSPVRLFTDIVFPLLQPVTASAVVLNAVTVFNDFTNPLYFLPGAQNATVQLTLNNFMGRYASSWHLLFADVVLITIPPLVLFIFFNRKIIDGMTAGAIKG